MEFADTLGFDGVCLNEHHQTAYGMMPIPGVLAGALARSVKRAKLAILGRALPLLNNPLMVAEEYAMLDNLTRGRFIAGFVRGIGAEYHAMGINPVVSQERFARGARPDRARLDRARAVRLRGQALSLQLREPVAAALSDAASADLDSLAGLVVDDQMGGAEALHLCADALARSRWWRASSRCIATRPRRRATTPSPDQLAWSNTIYVAETDEKAMREAKPHLEALVNRFLKMPVEMLLPPGYTNIESMKRVRAAKVTGKTMSIEDLNKTGVVIVGSPNTVREKLAEYQDLAGFNTSLTKTQFGTLPDDMTRANMTAIAEEILPHFRDRLPQGKQQAAAE